MLQLGLPMQGVKAIFVSHEHSDHITGIPALSRKHQLPVYITPATYKAAAIPIDTSLLHSFTAHEPIIIGSLSITPFPKVHDAVDPHSFIISWRHTTIGVLTDIGHACGDVNRYFGQCHAVFLESNYCAEMLANGRYPYFLKQRISGDNGHLSNTQALALFEAARHPGLQCLILSHLSKHNNDPQLVARLFHEKANGVSIVVASRYASTPVYAIEQGAAPGKADTKQQLSLF